MRKFIIIVFVFCGISTFSQIILDLDSLKSNYKVNIYTLNTQQLYGFNKTIELYNVFTGSNTLFLISVLPNLEGPKNWEKIEYSSVSDKILANSKLEIKLSEWLENNVPENKSLEYKLLRKDGEDYYIANICLTEVYSIYQYPSPIVSAYGTINIADSKVSIKEMKEAFEKLSPKQEFPLDPANNTLFNNTDNSYAYRNYLSKEYFIKGNKAYQFWTLDKWWRKGGGYDKSRGIDRFIYIPEKGIVGGSYDFYFAHKPKLMYNHNIPIPVPTEKLWNNIINEKVMIAEELK